MLGPTDHTRAWKLYCKWSNKLYSAFLSICEIQFLMQKFSLLLSAVNLCLNLHFLLNISFVVCIWHDVLRPSFHFEVQSNHVLYGIMSRTCSNFRTIIFFSVSCTLCGFLSLLQDYSVTLFLGEESSWHWSLQKHHFQISRNHKLVHKQERASQLSGNFNVQNKVGEKRTWESDF